jgi:predicted dinucleotide-binding enzyme
MLSRRQLLQGATTVSAALGIAPLGVVAPRTAAGQAASQSGLKIGIIGAGRIGGALGEHWVKAGHEVMLASRHPENLKDLAARLGPRARVGTPRDAAAFGDVVLVSVPYGAVPQVGRDYAAEMRGKIVLDTTNPFPARDGAVAEEARKKGTGAAVLEHLPGVRAVRAFNTIPAGVLRGEANRSGERVAVPLAGDDREALEIASRLVKDAGFEPVVVGPLSRAREFDPGTSVFGRGLTARELRQQLKLDGKGS